MPAPLPAAGQASVSRPLVVSLFVASCLLSVVSWYTTQQGMALYLSPWFSLLASLGVQSSLVLVAWLFGFNRSRQVLLLAVYAITALVSIAFSYVSLYTWFSARERPATIERRLYDELSAATGKTQELLSAAIAEGQKHVLALEEMTAAEKSHGYISRAQDSDPYLSKIREAVAREDRWLAAGAALDSVDDQVFLRDLVRKLVPSPQGLARVDGATLSSGELQLFLLLTAKGLAARSEEEGKLSYLLDQSLHQRMVESLAVRGLSLHANPQPARS